MKQIAILLFATTIFLSACASPVASTSAPVEQVEATSTSQAVDNTATAAPTPEPTATSTPVPPSPHWYWAVDSDITKVIAVNQFGDRKEIGKLDNADNLHITSVSLDDERALLFLDNDDSLRVYLLTPDDMQKIKFSSGPVYFNADLSQSSRAVVGVYGDYAVFTYTKMGAYQFSVTGAVDIGPVFLVNLKSLTADLVDKDGNRNSLDANRAWFRSSKDGRYLRYINGNPELDKMEIRELDLVTGKARTIKTTEGPPVRIHASPEGDLWYPDSANLILDTNGNQMDVTDEAQMFTPLKDGKVLVYPWNCINNCEIKVFSPFGNDAELTYNLPWTIESSTSYVKVRQLLPDQNLLFAGLPYVTLSKIPAIAKTYPDLTKDDIPLFRLAPDGQSRLVGTYVEGDFTSNISADARFILMKSLDKSSFFIYDAITDRPLFDIPIDTNLEDYYVMSIRFFDTGILVNFSASVPGEQNVYRYFYHTYVYDTFASTVWEDVNADINNCPNLLENGTLICWFYRTDSTNFDLAYYDPASGAKTIILENVWLINFAQ